MSWYLKKKVTGKNMFTLSTYNVKFNCHLWQCTLLTHQFTVRYMLAHPPTTSGSIAALNNQEAVKV